MLSMFTKKHFEVPFFSNDTLVYSSPTIDVGYKITQFKEPRKLQPQHMEVQGIRSVAYLDNISKCSNITKLVHPLVYSPLIDDLDDSHEIITLLEKDKLSEF